MTVTLPPLPYAPLDDSSGAKFSVYKTGVVRDRVTISARRRVQLADFANGKLSASLRRCKSYLADNGVENSGLAFISLEGDCPFSLFQGWRKEARHCGVVLPDALTLATCNREAKVTARTVILRRVEADGFVIMTDRRSRKSRDLEDVPSAAMVFLWCYIDEDGKVINRQVRVEGPVKELQQNEYQDLYDAEPLYCKIRSHICHQGQPIDWVEHKLNHDELFDKVHKQEQDLPMPDHFVAYKVVAEVIEFYYAFDKMIGDRILFVLDKATKQWKHQRIAA